MSSEREWLKVGAEVVTLRSDWRTNGHAPKSATVEKIGKRDVVLDNGERFNVNRLSRQQGGTWGWTVGLLPADSPVVAEARAAAIHREKLWRAKAACEDFRYDKGETTAADVILALAPLTGRADEIAALFERTAS
jgi:hypothetical protein